MAAVGPRRSLLYRAETERERLFRLLRHDGNTVAWYQPGVGVTGTLNASLWANWAAGTAGTAGDLAQATGANQPIYRSHTGTNYLYYSAVSGNYASAPDIAAYAVTDLSIAIRIALDDWTPAETTIFSQYGSLPSWALNIQASGIPKLYWTETDTTPRTAAATAAPVFSDGVAYWLFATIDVDNGAGGYDVKFFTAADAAVRPSSPTQLGSTVTGIATTSLRNSTDVIEVNGSAAGTSGMGTGKVYRAILDASIGGAAVFDADFTGVAEGAASFVESSSNAATVTINSAGATPAQIVGSPQLLFNGSAHGMATAAFTLNQPETVYLVLNKISWTVNDVIIDGLTDDSMLIYQRSGSTSPLLSIYAGAVLNQTSSAALNTWAITTAQYNGTSSLIQNNNDTAVTGDAGTVNAGGIELSRVITTPANFQIKELIVRSAADSAVTRLAIQQRLAALHGITL